MLPLVGIEPRPLITSDSKSNTILSTLTWHNIARSDRIGLKTKNPHIKTDKLLSRKALMNDLCICEQLSNRMPRINYSVDAGNANTPFYNASKSTFTSTALSKNFDR